MLDIKKRLTLSKPILNLYDIREFIKIEDNRELLKYLLLLNDNDLLPLYIGDSDSLSPAEYDDDYWEKREALNLDLGEMDEYQSNKCLEDLETKELIYMNNIEKYSIRPYKSWVKYDVGHLIVEEVKYKDRIYKPVLLHYDNKEIRLHGGLVGRVRYPVIDEPELFLVVKNVDFISFFKDILEIDKPTIKSILAIYNRDFQTLEQSQSTETIKEVEVIKEVEKIKEQLYLDTNHEYYSTELAVAIQIWNALYIGDGKYSIKQGTVANQSKKWIRDNYQNLDEDDVDKAYKKVQQLINHDTNKEHLSQFRKEYIKK